MSKPVTIAPTLKKQPTQRPLGMSTHVRNKRVTPKHSLASGFPSAVWPERSDLVDTLSPLDSTLSDPSAEYSPTTIESRMRNVTTRPTVGSKRVVDSAQLLTLEELDDPDTDTEEYTVTDSSDEDDFVQSDGDLATDEDDEDFMFRSF